MNVIYEGTDITNYVQVRSCLWKDSSGEHCDLLDIEFENAATWMRWGIREDEKIRATSKGIDTGELFVTAALPEEGKFRIVAASLPSGARHRENKSYAENTIEEILRSTAMRCGMEYQVLGIDGNLVIPYWLQSQESGAAALERLLSYESAVLKCCDGKLCAIGISYAQERAPEKTLTIKPETPGVEYIRRGARARTLRLYEATVSATATDHAALSTGHEMIVCGRGAREQIQAGRWARGLLLKHARTRESLRIETTLDASFYALGRIGVEGGTDADGDWVCECVEHDLKNESSTATMRRVISTIR